MHRTLAGTALFLAASLFAVSANADDRLAERRAACLGWMMNGYPSGLEETACTAQFDLPSPFLFKCARAERRGYDDATQRTACATFLADASDAAEQGYIRRRATN